MKQRRLWNGGPVPLLVGASVGAALWAGLVPWDLSEVDSAGRPLSGGDDNGGSIGLVALAMTGLGVALAANRQTKRAAPWVVAGGLTAWAVLFAWRASAAETIGANMYLAPLVAVVVPVAIGVPFLLHKVSSARWRRRDLRE